MKVAAMPSAMYTKVPTKNGAMLPIERSVDHNKRAVRYSVAEPTRIARTISARWSGIVFFRFAEAASVQSEVVEPRMTETKAHAAGISDEQVAEM